MSLIPTLFQDLNVFYLSNNKKYLITNPFFSIAKDGSSLTWFNYQPREKFYFYEDYYEWVSNNLQYSLAIDDKVLIQIFFHETGDKIVQGSLGFLPRPDLYFPYFRFDMDLLNSKDYYHNSYHVNFGYRSDDVRFSLHRFPHPSEFLRFVLFLMGREEFNRYNRNRFFDDLTKFDEKYSHLFDFSIV